MTTRRRLTTCGVLATVLLSGACSQDCDRDCLVGLMDRYLDAVVKNDPSLVPLAEGVVFVENTERLSVGEGLWQRASGGPTDFKIYVADPFVGQVGFMGILEADDRPVMLGARLRTVAGEITEIDHLVVYELWEAGLPNLQMPRPGLSQPLDPSERVPRDVMLAAANAYYDAIVQDHGMVAPFADECVRRENGVPSANAELTPVADPETGNVEPDDFAVFRRMTCADQLSTNVMAYITDITMRRLLAVDEDMGLVFAYSMFEHSGEPKVMEIRGVPGVTERANTWGPFNLPAAHVFKIRNGQIHEIEAMGYIAPYGIRNGWQSGGNASEELLETTVVPTEDFDLTGDGSARAWERAEWVRLERRGDRGLAYETRVKLLYSTRGLYVLFDGSDSQITATHTADFLDLWTEDVFEVFLWTDETYPVYFEYEISPLGYELPILIPNFEGEFLGWRPWHYEGERLTRRATTTFGGPRESGAAITGWRAEVFIPWPLLEPLRGVPPQPGSFWRANFYRVDHDGETPTAWYWAPVSGSFHDFHRFGILRFSP